jgi:hypothetical protein
MIRSAKSWLNEPANPNQSRSAILSPVYFAGIILAKSYALSSVAGASIGANILGAVRGGWFEHTTMVTGIKPMTLFALALYGASCLCLMAHRGRQRSPV